MAWIEDLSTKMAVEQFAQVRSHHAAGIDRGNDVRTFKDRVRSFIYDLGRGYGIELDLTKKQFRV